MKLAVIGGGGVRAPFLARSVARRAAACGIDRLALMDVDAGKLRTYGALARRTALIVEPRLGVDLTTDLRDAVSGADFVIATMRVGGDEGRAADERTALGLGLLGQETTGVCGFAMAMRTVPAMLRCCEEVERSAAPGALVFNFTNPAGLVTQAMRDGGHERAYGVCDAPGGLLRQVAALLGRDASELESLCFGLNHLSYIKSLRLDGRELLPALLEDDRLYERTEMRCFGKDLALRVGMLMNEYLFYYYYRERAVRNILGAGTSRGERILQINAAMSAELSALDPDRDFEAALRSYEKWLGRREGEYMSAETGIPQAKPPFKFDPLDRDEGGYAGVALDYVESAAAGRRSEMILNLPNGGAIPGLEDDDVVEASCEIGDGPPRPKSAGEVGAVELELIRRVKAYERLASRAILSKDREAAIEALFIHPLVASYSLAEEIFPAFAASAGADGLYGKGRA